MRLQADMRQLARVQVLLVHVFARARAAGHCTRPLQPHRASPGYPDIPSPRTTHPPPEIRILNLPPTCRPSPQTPSDDMSHQAGHTHYTNKQNKDKASMLPAACTATRPPARLLARQRLPSRLRARPLPLTSPTLPSRPLRRRHAWLPLPPPLPPPRLPSDRLPPRMRMSTMVMVMVMVIAALGSARRRRIGVPLACL